ncbi:hypothetical protein JYU34_002993 [Plutella xylostella]|uniref:Uncharacterized protein n=1 Tax=Plutella xylostella TaxID=51655 RepID=A0ABQ7R3Q7_PLUXY|nr:hypothetical protein JYU34_002993 [Plutella xylostella]
MDAVSSRHKYPLIIVTNLVYCPQSIQTHRSTTLRAAPLCNLLACDRVVGGGRAQIAERPLYGPSGWRRASGLRLTENAKITGSQHQILCNR